MMLKKFGILRVVKFACLFFGITSGRTATAQISSPKTVYNTERVLLLPSVSSKKTDNEIESIKKYSEKNYKKKGEYSGVVFLETPNVKKPGLALDARAEVCAKVRKRMRAEKSQKAKSNTNQIFRAVTCINDFEITQAEVTPNDPLIASQGFLYSNAASSLNAYKAWEYSTGSKDVVVGIADSGIDMNHPDLKENIWQNPFEIPGNEIDDDKNGYTDDVFGYDFAEDDNDPMDHSGHGTSVAGIVGASGNNGIGISGVNWKVKMIPMKIFLDNGKGYYSYVLKSMDYAAKMYDKGVNIVATNNSFGSASVAGSDSGVGNVMNPSLDMFAKRNILYVAAAGNTGNNSDVIPFVPASLYHPVILSVAAIDANANLATFSNYGVSSVDIAAPGTGVFTTKLGGLYGYNGGTSMAAPHVTGAVALLAGMDSGMTAQEIKLTIMNQGTKLSNLSGKLKSGSTLNLLALLEPFGLPREAPVLGDFNLDSRVDGADFLVWQRQAGLSGAELSADANADGKVDGNDLNIWKTESGKFAARVRGDYDVSGVLDGADFMVWQRLFGQTGKNLAADGNNDAKVDVADLQIWKDESWKSSLPALPGDYDLNGVVDGSDMLVWQRQVGLLGCGNSADGNRDCLVDVVDLNIWKDAY